MLPKRSFPDVQPRPRQERRTAAPSEVTGKTCVAHATSLMPSPTAHRSLFPACLYDYPFVRPCLPVRPCRGLHGHEEAGDGADGDGQAGEAFEEECVREEDQI